MKPYGWKLNLYSDEDYGPPSRHAPNIKKGNRKEARRIMHKSGRNQGKREIRNQIKEEDKENTFICSRCGTFTYESCRAGNTTECFYCY